MRRGYLDFTAEFARQVDIGTMLPRAWKITGSAGVTKGIVRLILENEELPDDPHDQGHVRLTVVVKEDSESKSVQVVMMDDRPGAEPVSLEPRRYFIGADDSGHRYAVPVDRRDDWANWSERAANPSTFDPGAWNAPDYVVRIEGDFTFTDPQPL